MAAITDTKLRVHGMIPVFQLMSAEGKTVNLWSFKGLNNIVLVVLDSGDCEACNMFLSNAVSNYEQYEEEDAVLLVILRGNVDQAVRLRDTLKSPFPILHDPEGNVAASYTDRFPAVFVADRFGELYAQWIVGPEGSFPSQKQIIDQIDLINLECPECGARLEWY